MKRTKSEEKLIRAFCKQLLVKPLDELTVYDIYTEAGVSQSTFYNYFNGKQDLVDTSLSYSFDKLTQILNQDLTYQKPVITSLLDEIKADRDIYFPLVIAYPKMNELVENYVHSMIQHSRIIDINHQLEDAYGFPAKFAFEVYTSTIMNIILKWISHNFEEPTEEITNIIFDAVPI